MRKNLIIIIILAAIVFVGGMYGLKQLKSSVLNIDVDDEIYEPCPLMDPITLKVGDVYIRYPAKLDAYIYADEEGPEYPRRIIKDLRLKYQVCQSESAYHHASSISIPSLSPNNWADRWGKPGWVPAGVFTGFSANKTGARPYNAEDSGYKQDMATCRMREETEHEGCYLYRFLDDVGIMISATISTTDVNLYGKPIAAGRKQTRENWPAFMDNLEEFWRAFIIDAPQMQVD